MEQRIVEVVELKKKKHTCLEINLFPLINLFFFFVKGHIIMMGMKEGMEPDSTRWWTHDRRRDIPKQGLDVRNLTTSLYFATPYL